MTAVSEPVPVAVLGLGGMGRALAAALLKAGHPTSVWNRTPGKDADAAAAGALRTHSADEAVASARLVIVCLLDHRSVRDVLEPVAHDLRGRSVVNVTSTTPDESRELARWAEEKGAAYLDGGIMAGPEMIGQPEASVLYSGSQAVFDAHRAELGLFGSAEYFGPDAGLASLYDFALLAAMYAMFAGAYHGAAMVRSAGVPATEFAQRVVPWLQAMAAGVAHEAEAMDTGDYSAQEQSLDFTKSAVDAIVRSSRAAGVGLDVINPVKALIDAQVADGHGAKASGRIFEALRPMGSVGPASG